MERTKQLQIFVKYFNDFFNSKKITYKIFIIEQANDNKKFNRGRLLNIGFNIAKKEKYNLFIFHDVDLLPSEGLFKYYSNIYESPVHIANVWTSRYANNPKYFGGIVAFNADDYEKINGYPNTFWGWGGEDDELYLRVVDSKINIIKPSVKEGTIKDLENLNISQKMEILKKDQAKCQNKWELLDLHKKNWRKDGLNSIQYNIESTYSCGDNCVNILCGKNGY